MTNQDLLHRTVGLVLRSDVRCHGAPPLLPAGRDLSIIVFFAETISLSENAFDRDSALEELKLPNQEHFLYILRARLPLLFRDWVIRYVHIRTQ